MKSYTVLHILLFLLLMLAYQCAGAQDFVVTTSGDTLRGEVQILNFGPDKKVKLMTGGDKQFIPMLKVRQAKSDDAIYEPVRRGNQYVFMKVLRSGYLTLYGFQAENQTNYDGLYLVKKDGARLEVANISFRKLTSEFLEDCSEVSQKISNGDLNKKDLNQIVDEYNACIEARTKSQGITAARPTSGWDDFHGKVNKSSDFPNKADALDMITEIKNKTARGEKIPNFLIEGLKASLEGTDLKATLEEMLREEGN